ncbi:MAG TPA: DUF2569 family protein [Allosphingosinicella sp.]|nr:DUF2569 family protein [Allosphingosinicella sp.]
MAYNDEGGAGVGGWLAFFVLVLGFFTPVGMVVSLVSTLYGDPSIAPAYGAQWATLQTFEWSLLAAIAAGCWYIVWRLHKVQVWQTVRMTIAWLWILAIGSTSVDFIGISLITGLPVRDLMQGADVEIARPFVFAVVWTAYFLRSKRVANTYLKHDDPEAVAEVFG